jgi:hypothetical protein
MVEEIKIKDVVSNNKMAVFSHAIAGVLYYNVDDKENGIRYIFQVDMNDKEDVGTATFNSTEKAITLMRYIRKSKETDDLWKGKLIQIK